MRLLKVKGVKLKKKKFKRNGTVAINLYTVKKQNYLDITKPWVYSVKKKQKKKTASIHNYMGPGVAKASFCPPRPPSLTMRVSSL
jgi:outer membrane phospholipase A